MKKVVLTVLLLLCLFVGLGVVLRPQRWLPAPGPAPSLAGEWQGQDLRLTLFPSGEQLRVSGLDPGESLTFVPAGPNVWLENPPRLKVPRRLEWKGASSHLELRVIDDSNSQSVQQLKKVQ